MKIPFLNLPKQYENIENDIKNNIHQALSLGKYVMNNEEFISNFANYCQTKYCIGVGNGTDALELAVQALNLPSNSEIITVSNSYIATTLGITNNRHKPIFVDINEDFLIDIDLIESKISDKTKAIIPVHLYGQMVDMRKINYIANKYNLFVIEDCAQAHGAILDGKPAGSWGTLGCFSFYPGKNLGCYGDGGAIVTNNEYFYNKIKKLHNLGCEKKYYHDITGRNSRLDYIQACILNVKLNYLNLWNQKRQYIAKLYNQAFKDDKNIKIHIPEDINTHVYHLYVIRIDSNLRDNFQVYLKEKGIETLIHYPIPIHKQNAYNEYNNINIPKTEKYANEIISLPCYSEMSDNDVNYVIQNIKEYFININNNIIKTAIIGAGYWGKNIIRNVINKSSQFKLLYICDLSLNLLSNIKETFKEKNIIYTTDINDIINDNDVKLVYLVTPPITHYELAMKFLLTKKNIVVEKPLCDSSEKVKNLIKISKENNCQIFVDYTYIYNNNIIELKKQINNKGKNNCTYVEMYRENMGLIQKNTNAAWDLAPHDISILVYIFGNIFNKVQAFGLRSFENFEETVINIILYSDENIKVECKFSWIHPFKKRNANFYFNDGTLVFDELTKNKLKFIKKYPKIDTFNISYIDEGETNIHVYEKEALSNLMDYIYNTITNNHTINNDFDIYITKILEGIQISLDNNNNIINI